MPEEIIIDYEAISNILYGRHKVGDLVDGQRWYSIAEFIEAKFRLSKQKENVFYGILIHSMARTGEIDSYRKGIFNQVYDICKQKIQEAKALAEAPVPIAETKSTVTAPVIALFCAIVNDSNQLIKGIDESKADYCKRVCKAYNFDYSDNIRQKFKDGIPEIKPNNTHFKTMRNSILNLLEPDKKNPIETYLNGRINLYC